MFSRKNEFKKFKNKIWLSSPTMHGKGKLYMNEAYETNWMSTVGENINEDSIWQARAGKRHPIWKIRGSK